MQTTRIGPHSVTGPSTDFYGGADIVAQSQAGNYSVVRVSATAINRGNTSSYDGYSGSHSMSIDGYGGSASYSGTMPSGYGNGATRWDQTADITVAHDADGNRAAVTLRHVMSWPDLPGTNATASFGGFPRIPKPPTAPGTPVVSNLVSTTLTLTWSASTDNGGSAIDGYLVRRWDNAAGTGAYTDISQTNTLTRDLTGLNPGQEYRFVIYAHNGSNGQYSPASTAVVVRMLSGFWVKWLGAWKRAVPYVKVAGVWKAVTVYVKTSGVWKLGS